MQLIDTYRFLRRILWVVFVISVAGVAFSGSLTYEELRGRAAACPSPGAPGTILGHPACVYGLAMYAVLALTSWWALIRTGRLEESAT